MKIGIMTFHWGSNYGAVLQCYALSEKLSQMGCEIEVIDYYPQRYKHRFLNSFRTRNPKNIPRNLREIIKFNKIEKFREEYIKRTKYFSSDAELKNAQLDFDCFICGSDQVWNESFICHGEKGTHTYAYFLDFAPEEKIKASYAASFGTTKYKDELKDEIKNHLKSFDFISVRENSGKDILTELGIDNSIVVPDPTLLLKKADYEELFTKKDKTNKYVFEYILHGKEKDAKTINNQLKNKGYSIKKCKALKVYEWLEGIYYADMVVTNSFHGVVFSIIFERPFIAMLIKGSGMNDRIKTLLNILGLEERIYDGKEKAFESEIDWKSVKEKLAKFREVGEDYLAEIIEFEKGN